MRRRSTLLQLLIQTRPDLADPQTLIASGRVMVAGRVVTNPRSVVRSGESIVVRPETVLRGTAKLGEAVAMFGPAIAGHVALDVGAAAGGFTAALLAAGASRVYAVDAGYGELIGSLRADERVVVLESTNVADLDGRLVPDAVGIVTVDVSYLSLSSALSQLGTVAFRQGAELLGLVKPMFELRLPDAPTDGPVLDEAISAAAAGAARAGWTVVATARSAVGGAGGAAEGWIYARRALDED